MKRYLAVLSMIVTLTFAGCCTLTAPDGTETKSFTNCLSSESVNYICSGENGKLTAADMLAALELGKDIYAGKPIDIETAISVLTVIKKTGCFAVDQLKKVFEVVDSVNATVAAKQMKALKTSPASLPEYKPLRIYIQ